jgi:hypothetical membrane protein
MIVRVLALGGLAGPVLFSALVVVCGALRPGYDHATQFISELGESGGSHADLMNFVGFIPSGILLAAFGASLATVVPRTAASVCGALLMTTFGLGMSAAGVYPCDPGCPRQNLSFAAILHQVVSIIALVAGTVGTGFWAYRFRSLPAWRSLWRYTAASSVIAFVLLMATNASAESRAFTGVWQRLLLATLFLWCAIVGVRASHANG